MFSSLAKLLHVEVKFMHRIHQRNLGQSLVHDVGVSKRVLKGKNAYFIKWKGYLSLQNSWEPEENLNTFALSP